jgi:hypothetical protein
MKFRVTYFRDYSASEKWERDVTLADLAAKIAEVTRPTKEQLPWLKLACFGDKRTDRGSLRHDANVRWVSGAEWDYDGGKMAFGEAVEVTEKLGLMALLYTSPSHTEDLPRWRILCPFSLGLLPDRRRQQLGRLNGAFRGIFARESWTLSQAFYFGSVNANPSHRVETIYGHTIDQLDELDECWIGPPGRSRCVYYADTDASAEAREDAELIRSCVTGEHLHVELCALAARYVGRGVPLATVEGMLRGIMLATPETARDERWQARYASISELLDSAWKKFGGERAAARRTVAAAAWRATEAGLTPDAIAEATISAGEAAGLPLDAVQAVLAHVLHAMKARRNA